MNPLREYIQEGLLDINANTIDLGVELPVIKTNMINELLDHNFTFNNSYKAEAYWAIMSSVISIVENTSNPESKKYAQLISNEIEQRFGRRLPNLETLQKLKDGKIFWEELDRICGTYNKIIKDIFISNLKVNIQFKTDNGNLLVKCAKDISNIKKYVSDVLINGDSIAQFEQSVKTKKWPMHQQDIEKLKKTHPEIDWDDIMARSTTTQITFSVLKDII